MMAMLGGAIKAVVAIGHRGVSDFDWAPVSRASILMNLGFPHKI